MPSVNNLVIKTALTTVENKIPDVSNLATKTTLTTVENKIPDIFPTSYHKSCPRWNFMHF